MVSLVQGRVDPQTQDKGYRWGNFEIHEATRCLSSRVGQVILSLGSEVMIFGSEIPITLQACKQCRVWGADFLQMNRRRASCGFRVYAALLGLLCVEV